jgi:hypothetical protein
MTHPPIDLLTIDELLSYVDTYNQSVLRIMAGSAPLECINVITYIELIRRAIRKDETAGNSAKTAYRLGRSIHQLEREMMHRTLVDGPRNQNLRRKTTGREVLRVIGKFTSNGVPKRKICAEAAKVLGVTPTTIRRYLRTLRPQG